LSINLLFNVIIKPTEKAFYLSNIESEYHMKNKQQSFDVNQELPSSQSRKAFSIKKRE